MTRLAKVARPQGRVMSRAESDQVPQGTTLDDPSSISLTANRLWQLWRQGFSPAFIEASFWVARRYSMIGPTF